MRNKYADFTRNTYDQFSKAIEAGIESFGVIVPVVTRESNRITIGADKKDLPAAPHTISLRRHPSEVIRVSLESALGLSCPDPLPGVGWDVTGLPEDVAIAAPGVKRYEGIIILSRPDSLSVIGAGYDGEYCHLNGLGERDQRLFVSQVAGAAMRESLKLDTVA